MTQRRTAPRQSERFLEFTQCTHCSYDLVTGEGERSCNYGTCANLPEELDVTCPTCNYNFVTRETWPGCKGSEPCDFAIYEGPQRVRNLRAWQAHRAAGVGAG
jgi:hypothetical protein